MIDLLSVIVGIAMLVTLVGGLTVLGMLSFGGVRFLGSPEHAKRRRAALEKAATRRTDQPKRGR